MDESILDLIFILVPIGYLALFIVLVYAYGKNGFDTRKKDYYIQSRDKFAKRFFLFCAWLPIIWPLGFAIAHGLVPKRSSCIVYTYETIKRFDFYEDIVLYVFLVLPVVALLLSLYKTLRSTGNEREIYKKSLHVLFSGFLLLIFVSSFFLASLNTARTKSRDAKRIGDIRQIQLAIELYMDGENPGKYPLVAGTTSQERWNELEVYLVPTYISVMPHDPCSERNPDWEYDYKNSEDGAGYVVKATLSSETNGAFNNDIIEDEKYGIDCRDEIRAFCVTN